MKVLVIIPAYNEEKNIESVIKQLQKDAPFADHLIINDCSTDNTAMICSRNHFNYISLPINLGIGGGIQAGYKYGVAAGYDAIVQFDGDGQHNASYISELLEPLENKEADMVTGSRFIEKEGFQTSSSRRIGIVILNVAIRLVAGVKVTDATSGFRAVNRELAEFFCEHYAQDYPEPEAIVEASLAGFKTVEAPVVMNERIAGVSSINLLRSGYYMIKVLLAIFIHRIGRRKRRT